MRPVADPATTDRRCRGTTTAAGHLTFWPSLASSAGAGPRPPVNRPPVRQAGGRCFEAHAHQDIDDTVAPDADDVIRGDVNLPPGQRDLLYVAAFAPAVANPKTRLWCAPHQGRFSVARTTPRPALSRNHDRGRPTIAELGDLAGIVIAGRSFRRLHGLRDRRVNP